MNFPIPVFFIFFVAFAAFAAFKRSRQTQNQNHANLSFLERERIANNTRKKDISNLNYLNFCAERLPLSVCEDPTLNAIETTLKELADQKIINLSQYSNTDLKMMYGPANLTALSEYDDNYHRLATTLTAYAVRLEELNHVAAATAALEYAMELGIQFSQIYLKLAELYRKQHTPEKISSIQEALLAMEESFASHVLPKLDNPTEAS